MSNFDSVLREAERFNCHLRDRRDGAPATATTLARAKALRLHATEAALGLRDGRLRDLLLAVRHRAGAIEKNARRNLMSPAPGQAV